MNVLESELVRFTQMSVPTGKKWLSHLLEPTLHCGGCGHCNRARRCRVVGRQPCAPPWICGAWLAGPPDSSRSWSNHNRRSRSCDERRSVARCSVSPWIASWAPAHAPGAGVWADHLGWERERGRGKTLNLCASYWVIKYQKNSSYWDVSVHLASTCNSW